MLHILLGMDEPARERAGTQALPSFCPFSHIPPLLDQVLQEAGTKIGLDMQEIDEEIHL